MIFNLSNGQLWKSHGIKTLKFTKFIIFMQQMHYNLMYIFKFLGGDTPRLPLVMGTRIVNRLGLSQNSGRAREHIMKIGHGK